MRIFLLCATVLLLGLANGARADEGGTSFWLPGQMGSFSALPGEPGWSLSFVHHQASVGPQARFAR